MRARPSALSAQAKPGGLGEAPEHDVAGEPRVTLLEAMRAAEGHDRIAWNYAHDFADIFDLGRKWLIQGSERWGEVPWAVTRVYLGFLAHLPDTLIERKFGPARPLSCARRPSRSRRASPEPSARHHDRALMAFDRSLKERGLNPGTSADLTVATLFAAPRSGQNKAGNPRRGGNNRLADRSGPGLCSRRVAPTRSCGRRRDLSAASPPAARELMFVGISRTREGG